MPYEPSSTELLGAGERGLRNPVGHNNCFLNSILQIFFHFEEFREAVIREGTELNEKTTAPPLPGVSGKMFVNRNTKASAQESVVMELGYLFTRFKMTEGAVLNPKDMRESLSKIIPSFATGSLEDAHECYEVLLNTLHTVCGRKRKIRSSEPSVPSGIAHDFFGIHTQQKAECDCGKTKRVVYSDECFCRTVIASTLIEDTGSMAFQRLAGQQEAPITCDHCKAKIDMSTTLRTAPPKIFTLNISWSKLHCTRSELRKLMSSIPVKWRIQDCLQSRTETRSVAVLQGIVFYYGCHYVSSYFNRRLQVWVIFDDSNIRAAAKSIPGLWQYAVNGKLMPFMLYYLVGAATDEGIQAATSCFDLAVNNEPKVVKHVPEKLLEWLKANTRKDVGEEDEPSEEGDLTVVPSSAEIIDIDATPEQRQQQLKRYAEPCNDTPSLTLFDSYRSYAPTPSPPKVERSLFPTGTRQKYSAKKPSPDPIPSMAAMHRSLYFKNLDPNDLDRTADIFEKVTRVKVEQSRLAQLNLS
eukprot:TRINITY_DN22191_c0_g1_i1.p1 TRINITY_DN22191_c0_g1~~TRINITY_DN22191_c0_g1_i1.p1  ORF type:complete len:541 (+),score=101.31 TRINITY_DN22191_c0_g1_i1:50-1624(+)